MLRGKFKNLTETLMLRVKSISLTKALPIVLILVILVFIPPFLVDYYLSILRDVLMWVALSICWNFFSGSTKYISLGSAAFFGIGLYFTAVYLERSVKFGLYPVLPLPVIVLLAGLVSFALALVVGVVTLRLRGIYFAILTFSVSMVAMYLVKWWESGQHTLGMLAPVVFDTQTCYYSILICAIVIVVATTLLRRSKFGLGLKMIGENEEAAVHVGVNASLYKTLGFAVSAMLIGFMGASYMTRLGYINPYIAFDSASYSFLPPVMTLLGGIGTVYGPVIGAIALVLLQNFLGVTLVNYFLIILGSIVIAIVMLMPNGIMGMLERIEIKPSRGKKSGGKKSGSKKSGAKKG